MSSARLFYYCDMCEEDCYEFSQEFRIAFFDEKGEEFCYDVIETCGMCGNDEVLTLYRGKDYQLTNDGEMVPIKKSI